MGAFEASLQQPLSAAGGTTAPFSARARNLTALAGLGSFALIAIAAFVAPPLWEAPSSSASAANLAHYLQVNHTATIDSLYIYSLAMGLFLCFSAGLWSWLREFEPGSKPLTAVFALGAVALTVLILAAFAIAGVMSYRPQPPAFALTLTDTTFALLALSGIPTAVCLSAFGVIVLRHRCLPAWTAWLAFLAVDAHVLIAASFMGHGGFLSLEGAVILVVPATFFAWILATSVVLLRGGEHAAQLAPR